MDDQTKEELLLTRIVQLRAALTTIARMGGYQAGIAQDALRTDDAMALQADKP